MKKFLLCFFMAIGLFLAPIPQQELKADVITHVIKIIKKTISTANTCVEKAFSLTWEYKYHLCLLVLTTYTCYLATVSNLDARVMLALVKTHKDLIIQKIYYFIFQENEHSLRTIFNRIRDFIFATFIIKAKDKVAAEIDAPENATNSDTKSNHAPANAA